MVGKTIISPIVNALGVSGIAAIIWYVMNKLNKTGEMNDKILLVVAALFGVIIIAFLMDYLKKKAGVDTVTVIKDGKAVVEEGKKVLVEMNKGNVACPTPVMPGTYVPTAPVTPVVPMPAVAVQEYESLQTQYGTFKRKIVGDPVGAYFGKVDLGKGAFDVVYIDIEPWQAAGGRIIKVVQIPDSMPWYTVFSRYGLNKQGMYSKNENTVYGLTENVFAGDQSEEMKKREALKGKTIDAYNKWKGLYGTGREVTGARYDEVILSEIAAAGLSPEQLIQMMGV